MSTNITTYEFVGLIPDQKRWDDTPEAVIELLRQVPSRHPQRPERPGNGEYGSLYDAICFDQLTASLQTAEATGDPAAYDAQRLAVADHINRTVNGALNFPDEGKDPADRRVPPAVANLKANQVVDCYGFTALASSCLELAGLQHWIAWGNGHSFIVLPVGEGDNSSLYFMDPLTPRLSRKLDGMVPRSDLGDIPAQLAEHGRAVFRLHTDNFDDPQRPYEGFDILARRNPWMKLGHRPNVHESLMREARTQIFVSVFPPKDGRMVLDAHNRLVRATNTGDLQSATQAALELYGQHPELDARNDEDFKRIHAHVQQLCAEGRFATALHVTEAYFASFKLSDDTRISLRQEQCLRSIVSATQAAVGKLALGAEFGTTQAADDLDSVSSRARRAAQQSLAEAQERYSRADHRLRPRHVQDVITGRQATLIKR